MSKFKKAVLIHLMALALVFTPTTGRADMWGGDLIYLAQILANAVQQLAQLKEILGNGRDNLNLIREINRGINDSLGIVRTIYPNIDPGLYKDWDRIDQALRGLEQIYGAVTPSQDARVQRDTDQSVAEAISLNNSIYKYTSDIDKIGEAIKQYSQAVSPGGAQKLTAESLGVMLTVMNQSLRTQATGLKIQAQALALQNHREKEMTRHMMDISGQLGDSLKTQSPDYKLPRF